MDFKQLQSFISVVRCKSFTEAAEELGISQPTISTHIRILEEELNSRLIVLSLIHTSVWRSDTTESGSRA